MEHDPAGTRETNTGNAASTYSLPQTSFAERHVAGKLSEVNELRRGSAWVGWQHRSHAQVFGRASRDICLHLRIGYCAPPGLSLGRRSAGAGTTTQWGSGSWICHWMLGNACQIRRRWELCRGAEIGSRGSTSLDQQDCLRHPGNCAIPLVAVIGFPLSFGNQLVGNGTQFFRVFLGQL